MKQFRPAKKRITVSTGESVRIIRELQGLTRINSRSVQAFLRPLFQGSRTTASAWAWSARRCSRELSNAIPPCWSSRDGKIIFKLRHKLAPRVR